MPQIRFPTVWNPSDHILYVDDPYSKEPSYDIPLINCRAYMTEVGGASKAASTQHNQNVFFDNDKPEYNFEDIANQYYDKIAQSRTAPTHKERVSKAAALLESDDSQDFQNQLILVQSMYRNVLRSKAGAVITSLDFPDYQNTTFLGAQNETAIRTGILAGLFQTVATPNLSGKWQSAFANDLKYFRNIPESKSPEPSKGTGAITTVSVQKHGGAVAITQRAELVINADNPFQRLVAQMGQKKLFDENDMVADEIESNTSNSISGVDFGARTGTPPASTTNPTDLLTSIITTFEALSQPVNLFISRGFMFNEYVLNDIIRGGVNNVPASQGNINEQVSSFPLLDGVRWARDNAITATTAGWALNDNAIKNFRGPSRNYTIADEDTETTKYVTKNYFLPKTMDTALIYKVTGIAA